MSEMSESPERAFVVLEPGEDLPPVARCVIHRCTGVAFDYSSGKWGCADDHSGPMRDGSRVPCRVEGPDGKEPEPLPPKPLDPASLSPFELNYRKSMGMLIQAMNGSSRVSRLDVRADRLEVIVQNQIVTMQALLMAMDLLLQMCGRPAEIQFTPRESVQAAPGNGLVVAS